MVQRTLPVSGVGVDGWSLMLGPSGTVTGSIVTDDGAVPEMAAGALRVRAVPLGGALPVRLAAAAPGRSGPDWSFLLTGVGGVCLLRVHPLPPGENLVAAVDRAEEGAEEAPALLEELRPSASRVLPGEGERRTIALRLAEPRKQPTASAYGRVQ